MGKQIALIYLLSKNSEYYYLYIATGSVSEDLGKILDLVLKFLMIVCTSFLVRVVSTYGISLSVQYLLNVATASTNLENVTGLII